MTTLEHSVDARGTRGRKLRVSPESTHPNGFRAYAIITLAVLCWMVVLGTALGIVALVLR